MTDFNKSLFDLLWDKKCENVAIKPTNNGIGNDGYLHNDKSL